MPPKERGNNGAKRKVYDNLEEIVENVLPSDASFDEKASIFLFQRDVIRYKYIAPRLIKYIYQCKRYRMGDDFFEGKAPVAPFQNSNFDSFRKKKPKNKWKDLSLKVYTILEERLRAIERDPYTLPNHTLSQAAAYCLNELESIHNIITSTHYDLDNNQIERPMRYISISRRNSLFCGSDAGAQRTATLYSLAISCRLNDVNTFAYFTAIIQRLAERPTLSDDEMRNLLPDKWAEK